MVVQVAAAQDLVRGDPDRAEQTLQRVADTGRRALSETGRLLHVIRDTDDELGLAPTPGLRDLETLVDELRGQGLAVELILDPGPPDAALPVAVDVSAYRIVQEALTNALRYAPDRAVRLEVSVTGVGLTIHTRNRYDGRSGLGSGLGLVGLAERVELLGGTFRHGQTTDGDFELVAMLPVVRELVVTTVVVADDQELVRSGLELVLAARGCEVLGSAGDGREAVVQVRRHRPDVVLMDIRMPVLDGIAATREITNAGLETRVLVLTTYDLDAYVYEALRAGAAGFLLKATPPDRLAEGVRTVARGEALLAPSLTQRLIEAHVHQPTRLRPAPRARRPDRASSWRSST